MKGILLLAGLSALGLLFHLLWKNGWMMRSAKRAVLFTASSGRGRRAASFSCCSGWVKCILRFHGGRAYQFHFRSELTRGAVRAELADRKGELLLALDGAHPSGSLYIDRGGRCCLTCRFEKADGRYELTWR